MAEPEDLIEQGALARRQGRLDDAALAYADAVRRARARGSTRDLVVSLKGLGQIERDRGNPDTALCHYQEALALCRQLRDALLLAHTQRHVADLHRQAGRLVEALSGYREALAIDRRHDGASSIDLANTLHPMAILAEARGDVAEGVALWSEARDLYREAGVAGGAAECSARLDSLIG